MNAITDHHSLIDALGGNSALAAELTNHCGIPTTASHVSQWKLSKRIPAEYWISIVQFAMGKELRTATGGCVTTDWLARTLPPRRRPAAKANAEAAV